MYFDMVNITLNETAEHKCLDFLQVVLLLNKQPKHPYLLKRVL